MNTMKIKSEWAVKRLIRNKINSDVSENFLSGRLFYAVFRHAELDSASRANKSAINNKYVFIPILRSDKTMSSNQFIQIAPKNNFINNTKILFFGTLFVESCNARGGKPIKNGEYICAFDFIGFFAEQKDSGNKFEVNFFFKTGEYGDEENFEPFEENPVVIYKCK